jgi:3-hydroxybutyryl-CoA dehydrogenase
MGVGIAAMFAAAGIPTAIFEPVEEARRSIRERLGAAARDAGADPAAVDERVSVPDTLAEASHDARLVIEAAPENLAVKRAIFAELAEVTGPDTILASNTSAIPISRIAAGLPDPGRVLGTHFWHPPYLVPLVEVVRADATSAEATTVTIDLLASAGFKPVPVAADIPGFIGNRLQHALKREAIALVAAGVASAASVDTVVRLGFGRRLALVGPLEQADLGGLNLTLAIHEVLMPDLDVTREPHPYLAELVAKGDLGAKTGRGFYTWAPGEAERRLAEIAEGLR